tara:strand:- start:11235 stop:11339 length:105 start_codon:yes stop_codon:yes gene_type:complete
MSELDQNEIRVVAYQLWERDGSRKARPTITGTPP